jgi:putative transposase
MKRIRLTPAAYEEGACFSATLVCADRLSFFENGDLVDMGLRHLRSTASKCSASVYAYCFMPDHLHLLVDVAEGKSLIEFVRHFKQLTSYEFRHGHSYEDQALWQRRFYDHALRSDEAIEAVAQYIWGNPARAGLVSNQSDYPHWGSFVWDVAASGSKDPDLRGRDPPNAVEVVGAGLQTRAR